MQMIQEAKACWNDLKEYYRQTKVLRWFFAFLLLIVYGIRLVQEDLFIDSEIMLTDPGAMLFSWYGHKRPGLVWAKKLFGMGRLVPFLSNGLLVLMLWCLTFGLCFCMDYWDGRRKTDMGRNVLFSIFFLSAPCLVEQFNFLLQAFEIALAMLICLLAAFCAGLWVYEKRSPGWLMVAWGCMMWSFGFYQAFPAFYIALVVISYMGVFLQDRRTCGLKEGLWHVGIFLVGFVGSQLAAEVMARRTGASSSYVNAMFLWGKESLQTCLSNIRLEIWWMYQGNRPEFYHHFFTAVTAAASLLWLWIGWKRKGWRSDKKKTQKGDGLRCLCFAFAVVFLTVTPILITLLTGMNQPIRGQLVFPLVFAYEVMALYGGVKEILGKYKMVTAVVLLLGIRVGWGQCMTACQLWETAHEGYVQDVLTANRMYPDICQAAGEEPVEECTVVFVGQRGLSLAGDALVGDAIGHSFFQWDADVANGVSIRVQALFDVLGMNMKKPQVDEAQYQEAQDACQGRPVWPAKGSVFKIRDGLIAVKLSETS